MVDTSNAPVFWLMTVNTFLAIVLLGLTGTIAYGLAARFLPADKVSERVCAAGVAWHWLLIFTFYPLAHLGMFRIWASLLLFSLLTFFTLRFIQSFSSMREQAFHDIQVFFSRLYQAFQLKEATFFWAGMMTFFSSLARGLLLPPVSWDSLYYHLFWSGNVVQRGGIFSFPAPDVWGTYSQYFPPNAEILFAWFMLPFHGDSLVNLANYPAWLTAMVAFYCLGRHLGIQARNAALGAFLLGFNPAVFSYLNSAYVEIFLMANLLAGTLFLLKGISEDRLELVLVSAGAFGCALGTKLVAGPMGCLGVLYLILSRFSGKRSVPATAAGILGILFICLAVSVPAYAKGWIEKGSPTYPFALRIAGKVIFAGSEIVAKATPTAEPAQEAFFPSVMKEVKLYLGLFWPPSYNLGTTAFLALLFWPLGLLRLVRRKEFLFLGFVLPSLLFTLGGFFSPQMRPGLLISMVSCSRYLNFAFGLLLLFAIFSLQDSRAGGKNWRLLFLFSGAIDLFVALPFNWNTGLWFLNDFLIGSAGAVAVFSPLISPPFSPDFFLFFNRFFSRVLVQLSLFFILVSLLVVKEGDRNFFWENAFEIHPFPRLCASAWKTCDTPDKPMRIAVSAGWLKPGHNWFWYPLMGRRLQNTLSYIPITKSGEIIHYAEPEKVTAEADYSSWVSRLTENRIDTVVLLPPESPELKWVKEHPETFIPLDKEPIPQVYSFTPTGKPAPNR